MLRMVIVAQVMAHYSIDDYLEVVKLVVPFWNAVAVGHIYDSVVVMVNVGMNVNPEVAHAM